ncbi:hypothetical protein QUB70_02550 [Microcoleus sp. A003_D6]|uniref:hypothetical protein n=1 Tax=Microcoleus sp. A003_D6 TaxID=3055266 RepID=UPI002FD4A867
MSSCHWRSRSALHKARSVDETSYKGVVHHRKTIVIKGSLFFGCILSDLSKCWARSLLQTIQTIDIVVRGAKNGKP